MFSRKKHIFPFRSYHIIVIDSYLQEKGQGIIWQKRVENKMEVPLSAQGRLDSGASKKLILTQARNITVLLRIQKISLS